jgi:hypothetical protein
MDTRSEQDFHLQLPRDVFHQVIHALCEALPPPATDDPQDRIRRDNAAIAHLASMLPANADEAYLAAMHIVAVAKVLESERMSRQSGIDRAHGEKCEKQVSVMMREARASRALLLRVQVARQKREANPKSLDQANWTEHAAIGLMAHAMERPPRASVRSEPEPSPVPATSPPESIRSSRLQPDGNDAPEPNLAAILGGPRPPLAAFETATGPPHPA